MAPRHVLNGDVSHGDLARGNLLDFYDARLDGEDVLSGRPCYRLELTRTRNLGLYARIVCWIDVENFRPVRYRYYGHTGAILKTARYEDYRRGPLGVRAMRIEVASHTRPGERTTLTFSDLREFDPSPFEFSIAGMLSFRDAARALLQETGEQAPLEQLRSTLEAVTP
jgi:hypothetical protein